MAACTLTSSGLSADLMYPSGTLEQENGVGSSIIGVCFPSSLLGSAFLGVNEEGAGENSSLAVWQDEDSLMAAGQESVAVDGSTKTLPSLQAEVGIIAGCKWTACCWKGVGDSAEP